MRLSGTGVGVGIGDTAPEVIAQATSATAANAECAPGYVKVGPNCLPPAPELQGEVTGGKIVDWKQVCEPWQYWDSVNQACRFNTNWLYIAAAILGGFIVLKAASGNGGKKGRR